MKRTKFKSSHFKWAWYDRDFFYSMDGIGEHPDHHCKKTWIVSKPFITTARNAIDIGCRDGEYTRKILSMCIVLITESVSSFLIMLT